jgi:hypothetical protein
VVTGLVIEDGGDEDQAIAAMLHDAVEDGGGRPMLERISRSFSARVAAIVEACCDTVDHPDATESWIERKRRYLAHLPDIDHDAILGVALADKVHNAPSIVRDYCEEGHVLWERFTQKTARDQLWYYGGLLAFFQARRPGPLTEDLSRAVAELAWLVARDHAQRSKERMALGRSRNSRAPGAGRLDSGIDRRRGDRAARRIPGRGGLAPRPSGGILSDPIADRAGRRRSRPLAREADRVPRQRRDRRDRGAHPGDRRSLPRLLRQ